jgi:hypothetical protein
MRCQPVCNAITSARQTNAAKVHGLCIDYTGGGALLQLKGIGKNEARHRRTRLLWPCRGRRRQPDTVLDFDALGTYAEAAQDQFIARVRVYTRDDVHPPSLLLRIALAEQSTATGTSAHASLTHKPENKAAPDPTEVDSGAAQQVRGHNPRPPPVGPVGLEPTTNGLKVHCSAN